MKTCGLSILFHGVISPPDATSYDKRVLYVFTLNLAFLDVCLLKLSGIVQKKIKKNNVRKYSALKQLCFLFFSLYLLVNRDYMASKFAHSRPMWLAYPIHVNLLET